MPSYRVTPERFPILFREREQARAARVVKAIQETVLVEGPAIAVQQTQALGKYAPINTSNYLRGWKAEKLDNGAIVFNDTPYASVIEHGRRRGARMPPTKVIAEWLEQKMRGRVRNRAKRLRMAKSMAFVVARAIGRRGLPAKNIMKKTRRKLDPMVKKAVREALEG
jgi:hypothetical protein